MKIPQEDFDLSENDSCATGSETPELLFSRLLLSVQSLSNSELGDSIEHDTQLKLRAILNSLVHDGLIKDEDSKATPNSSLKLPKLSEINIALDSGLELVHIQNQLVIFAPHIDESTNVVDLIRCLNRLTNRSHGARTWILDLSLVNIIPFELFGYLIGLKLTLNRLQIKLDLMWLKAEAVPQELRSSITEHFQLYSKGAFLLSR